MRARGRSKYGKVGDVLESKSHGKYEIIEFKSYQDITVKFLESGHIQNISAHAIKFNTLVDWSHYSPEKAVAKMKAVSPQFDYSKFVFINGKTKSIVICPEHGEWEVCYDKIVQGRGCPRCRGYYQKTEDVVAKLKSVFGDQYDFSKVTYRKAVEKVEVVCPKHGSFFTIVKTLLKGHGCKQCANERASQAMTATTDEFVAKAVAVHGTEKYDYSLVDYKGCFESVQIRCKVHDIVFSQQASVHLTGCGCPSCAGSGFDKSKMGSFYILTSDDMIKVGITNRDVSKRIEEINKKSPQRFSLLKAYDMDGLLCRDLEMKALKWLRCNFTQPSQRFDGFSESFIGVPLAPLLNVVQECVNG